jgi:hypothetical protein
MRFLFYVFLFCLIALPVSIGGAAYLALADQPTINRTAEFTPAHIERAKRIIETNKPGAMNAGELRTVRLSRDDADLALNYLANRYAKGSSHIVLQPMSAAISASIELPRNPLGRFVNIAAVLHETSALPGFDSLKVGRLPVPAWVADALLEIAVQQLKKREEYRIAADTIKKVSVAADGLTVTYAWQSDISNRIKAVILPREEQERLKAYQDRLAEISRHLPGGTSASLTDLLRPLFKFAAERSTTGDPISENRAVIMTVAFFVNGRGLGAIVPVARNWPRPAPRKIVLGGRDDFAQHFAISAAIAAYAGAPLSDAIGQYKEIDDSREGSGFSFNDIAADRAGTRFGELAVSNRESAAKLQRQVVAGVRDIDILPRVSDLPEFMPEAEFKRRYGGIGGSAYTIMMADIERRVAALPLYR